MESIILAFYVRFMAHLRLVSWLTEVVLTVVTSRILGRSFSA